MATLPGRATRRWTLKPPVGTPVNALSSLAFGLVAHWGMNDGAGTRLAALGSTDAPATASGATWAWRATVAPLFQCPTFPGNTTDVLTVPHQAAVSPLTKSVAAWFLLTALPAAFLSVAYKNLDYILRVESGHQMGWYVWANSVVRNVVGAAVPVGVPHFAVGTWDGLNLRLYQNGRQTIASAPGGVTNTGTNPLTLGSDGTTAGSLYGALGMVTLWNRALTPAEVMELYVNPFALWAPQPALHQQLVPVASAVIVPPSGAGLAALDVGHRRRGPGPVLG